MCLNFLIEAQNKKKFKYIIRRIAKSLDPIYQSVQELSKKDPNKTIKESGDNQRINTE